MNILETFIFAFLRDICLNGKVMKMSKAGKVPALKPLLETTNVIELPPHSMAFYVVHNYLAPACD